MVARSGRLGGYYARYTNYGSAASPRWRYVNSAADVFRRPDGAAVYLDLVREADQKELTGPVKRTSANIGTSGPGVQQLLPGRWNRGHLAVLTRRRMGDVPGDDRPPAARDRARPKAAATDRGGTSLDGARAPSALIAAATLALPAFAGRSIPKRWFSPKRISPPGTGSNHGGTATSSRTRACRVLCPRTRSWSLAPAASRGTWRDTTREPAGSCGRFSPSCMSSAGRKEPGLFLLWIDAEQRRHNAKRGALFADGREGTAIGDQSWVYWSGYPGYYAIVTWRQARFLGIVASWGIGKERTLALARVQQRRIAAAQCASASAGSRGRPCSSSGPATGS